MPDTRINVQMTKEQYEAVTGYSIPTPRDGTSGGYIEGNVRVTYDINSGFSGGGWYTGQSNSPFHNFTAEQIAEAEQYFRDKGHLNKYFDEWGNNSSLTGEQRGDFAFQMITNGCGSITI